MTNPVNWGESPFANGAVRGVIAAIITGLLYAIYELQKGTEIAQAAMAGAVPMLLAFLALLGYGVVDQGRVNGGTVIASDVPIQLEAKLGGTVRTRGDADQPPLQKQTPRELAEVMTNRYQKQLHD